MSLDGRRAVVVGASGVIGHAIAQALAEEGTRLVLGSNMHPEAASEIASRLCDAGGEAIAISADVSSPSGAQALVDAAQDALGGVDILINCAGATVGGGAFEDLTEDDWISAYRANVLSNVLPAQLIGPRMVQQGYGRIVNITSVRGLLTSGRTSIMAYSAAKAALANATVTIAKELGPNVLVNAIAPGFVYTPNYDSMTEELRQSFLDASVTRAWVPAEDIAAAAVFLAGSSSVTGQVLIVDGGFSLKFA
jgi:3-oxoacyl-[acyl-carrier protein] reductase